MCVLAVYVCVLAVCLCVERDVPQRERGAPTERRGGAVAESEQRRHGDAAAAAPLRTGEEQEGGGDVQPRKVRLAWVIAATAVAVLSVALLLRRHAQLDGEARVWPGTRLQVPRIAVGERGVARAVAGVAHPALLVDTAAHREWAALVGPRAWHAGGAVSLPHDALPLLDDVHARAARNGTTAGCVPFTYSDRDAEWAAAFAEPFARLHGVPPACVLAPPREGNDAIAEGEAEAHLRRECDAQLSGGGVPPETRAALRQPLALYKTLPMGAASAERARLDCAPLEAMAADDSGLDNKDAETDGLGGVASNVWLGGAGACATPHYDTDDNVFVQLAGAKRVLMWAPEHAPAFHLHPAHHPRARQAQVTDPLRVSASPPFDPRALPAYEVVLRAGDVLFMPAFVLHHVTALSASVSVNVWTRSAAARAAQAVESTPMPLSPKWPHARVAAVVRALVNSVLNKAFASDGGARGVLLKLLRTRYRAWLPLLDADADDAAVEAAVDAFEREHREALGGAVGAWRAAMSSPDAAAALADMSGNVSNAGDAAAAGGGGLRPLVVRAASEVTQQLLQLREGVRLTVAHDHVEQLALFAVRAASSLVPVGGGGDGTDGSATGASGAGTAAVEHEPQRVVAFVVAVLLPAAR